MHGKGNTAAGRHTDGGAIYVGGGYVSLTSCTVEGNKAVTDGGYGSAIYVSGGRFALTNSRVTHNTVTSSSYGGTIYIVGGGVTYGCMVTGNTIETNLGGGGMYITDGQVVIVSSYFADNVIYNGDKDILMIPSITIINSTFHSGLKPVVETHKNAIHCFANMQSQHYRITVSVAVTKQ